MNKKVSVLIAGLISTLIIGCGNQSQPTQSTESVQPQQAKIQSNTGLNNLMRGVTDLLFNMLDKDKDNYLTLQEYMGSTSNQETFKTAFKKLDKDNDGKISLDDIKVSAKTFIAPFGDVINKERTRDYAKYMFSVADTNKDSMTDEKEFTTFIRNNFSYFLDPNSYQGVGLTSYMFQATDKNNDKKLTFSEFEDFYYDFTLGMFQASVSGAQPTPYPSSQHGNYTPGYPSTDAPDPYPY